MVLFRLTALIDGHSGIFPAQLGYHLYALRLYHFTDGYFVLDGPDPSAIGGQLVAINDTPVEDAVRLVTPLASHDNDKSIDVVVPMLLMTPEMLDGLGIVNDIAKPHFDVRRGGRKRGRPRPGNARLGSVHRPIRRGPRGVAQSTETTFAVASRRSVLVDDGRRRPLLPIQRGTRGQAPKAP